MSVPWRYVRVVTNSECWTHYWNIYCKVLPVHNFGFI
jgi:hypothetical protein